MKNAFQAVVIGGGVVGASVLYHLTKAGDELRPVLLSIAQWGDRWAVDEPVTAFVHTCGDEVELVHTCRACGGEVTGLDLRARRLTPVSAAAS